MEEEEKPTAKRITIDSRTHDELLGMAVLLGINPAEIVEEALAAYFHTSKEKLEECVQERLEEVFAKIEKRISFNTLPIEQEPKCHNCGVTKRECEACGA